VNLVSPGGNPIGCFLLPSRFFTSPTEGKAGGHAFRSRDRAPLSFVLVQTLFDRPRAPQGQLSLYHKSLAKVKRFAMGRACSNKKNRLAI